MELSLRGYLADSVRSIVHIRSALKNCFENLEHLHWYEFFTEMSGFRVALALHDTYVPTSEPSTVALVRTLMADVSPISERTPDPSRVIRFPHHFGWFETDPATGIAVQKGIEDLLGTAEERALCHRQLLDAGKPIKQLYHRMFLLNETASADDLKLLDSFTAPPTPLASPFSPEQSYYESDVTRSKIARELLFESAWRGGRVLFTTNQGFLGLGPPSTQIGDQACLLFGGDVPYILRPQASAPRNTWTFVGEAYIHGWMDGEMMSKQEVDGEVVEFNIV
jgi:hypothetical protein